MICDLYYNNIIIMNFDIYNIKLEPEKYGNSISLKELSSFLNYSNKAYYSSNPVISDNVYDILIDILTNRDSNNNFLKLVGYQNKEDNIKLPCFMGSMNKIKTFDEFSSWIKKYNKTSDFIVSEKLDGISALLTYDTPNKALDKNIKMFTRGNGTVGGDISFLIEYLKLPINVFNKFSSNSIKLRGELIINKRNFDNFKGDYNSARSMVNGLISRKNNTTNLHLLEFVLFEVVEPVLSPKEQFEFISKHKFKCVTNNIVNYNDIIIWKNNDDSYLLNKLNYLKKYSSYDIDGIIISHNNIYLKEDKNPRNSIAFKRNDLGIITTIKEINWNISKYKIFIPRINFETIKIKGSNISFCTGFSAKYIHNNCLGPGSKIRIVLSGEVIPYVSEIISNTYPQMPNENYIWDSNKLHIKLNDLISNTSNNSNNSNDDNGSNSSNNFKKKKLCHFIKTLKIDNLSIGIINKLYSNNYITIKQILQITVEQLLNINGIKNTLANKLYNNIHTIIDNEIDLATLMSASLLFDSGISIKRLNKINEKYPNIMTTKLTIDDIIKIEGFQIKIATQFINNLDKFKDFIKELDFIKYSIPNINIPDSNDNIIESIYNKNIVITGFRDASLELAIKQNKSVLQNNINSKTNVLIVKDSSINNSKTIKATELKIKILTLAEINEFI